MSQDWLGTYCENNKLGVRSALIECPDEYEPPTASTAADGRTVKNIEFARIRLMSVTLPIGFELELSEAGMDS